MAQKYDLTDIGNALSRVMDNPMTKIIRSGSIGVLGVVNPVAGIVGGIGNDLLSEYNTFKLGHLLNGLASGFNLERRLNELYNYVNSSPEKAIIVANLFKQTVNAECPKVCVIYGLILATVYKGNIIKNLIMDCQSYTKYRPNETTGGIFVSWRRKEELPTGA